MLETLEQPQLLPRPLYFPVTLLKLVIMSVVTGGMYEIYWFYKNWALVKEREKLNIRPFWRAFFAFFFCYPLFKRVNDSAISHGIAAGFSPGWLAASWICITITWRLPGAYWLITYFAVISLLPVQKTVNCLNMVSAPDSNPNARFSALNIVGIVLGGVVFVFGVIESFFPD